jgi:hypothetical protein
VNDKELGLIDIVGSTVTVSVTCPAIGQKLAAHLTVTVPTYVPAVKLLALTAIARSTSEGVTGMVPAVGLTDNQLPPEFVDSEAVKPMALPLETESSHLLDEHDRFALFRSYAHVMGASVVATWALLGSARQSTKKAANAKRPFCGCRNPTNPHQKDDLVYYTT